MTLKTPFLLELWLQMLMMIELFLAVQDSSISDIVGLSVGLSVGAN